jgi:Na+/H+ antiporter NhaC
MGHAGERGLEWAVTEGGVAGVVGAIIGAICGWPQKSYEPIGTSGLTLTTYHNAFSHGDLMKVLETGLFAAGVIAVVIAVLVAGIVGAIKRSAGSPTNPMDPPHA